MLKVNFAILLKVTNESSKDRRVNKKIGEFGVVDFYDFSRIFRKKFTFFLYVGHRKPTHRKTERFRFRDWAGARQWTCLRL